MPRPKGIPSYKLHKASGQARVIIDGRHVYLGAFGSLESHQEYARVIAEHLQHNPKQVSVERSRQAPTTDMSINDLILAYVTFAKGYYVRDGVATKEVAGIKDALRPLRELFGRTRANDFGPKRLAVMRQHMVTGQKLCRNEINKRIGRIKRLFKWGASQEFVDASVFHALQTVAGLRFGRSEARESQPVRPVSDHDVEATLPFLAPPLRAMVQIQRLSGMRPGEITIMRPMDIDRSSELWEYRPGVHKNSWRGHDRVIPLGPKAQEFLLPFLNRQPETFLFSPRDAEDWRLQQQAERAGKNRRTPIYPCEIRRCETARKQRRRRRRRRAPGERYDVAAYGRAIKYGVTRARKAGIEVMGWSPNQLRHSRATELRKQFGLEAAQVVLGHVKADTTQIYAEKDLELARKIARVSG